jgi:hypothetical protein
MVIMGWQSIEEKSTLADNLPRGASALINFSVLLDRMYVIEKISRKKQPSSLCFAFFKPETNHSGAVAQSLTVFTFIIIINVIQLFFFFFNQRR